MILVDTSVWIDFFRGDRRAARLSALVEAGEVVLHPWIQGELALGERGSRWQAALADLRALPRVAVVDDEEVLSFIEARDLAGRGIGWVDAHLLAAALAEKASLWSHDKRLAAVAATLNVASSAN